MMHRNKSVNVHQFAMVPRADIPRAAFKMMTSHKTTFDAGYLIPVFCEEVLPGDTFNVNMTAFARLATPLFPLMDNIYLDTFFFFVPNRLVWDNWIRFMGEQDAPGDSIDFLVPTVTSPVGGFQPLSVFDYFGLPTVGQVGAGNTVTCSSLPLRGYNLIYNEWFRDENLKNPWTLARGGDGPDAYTEFGLSRRGKRHDYFTSALPWPQKGEAVPLPLGGEAPVFTYENSHTPGVSQFPVKYAFAATGTDVNVNRSLGTSASGQGAVSSTAFTVSSTVFPSNLYADLTEATNLTINALRQSMQIQKLLERDARGGTRYAEIVRSHFGVVSPDARLQRPEYLGGGSSPIVLNPVAQTSATDVTGSTSPLGQLGAVGTTVARNGFTSSFVEHGYVIGLVSARADLTYQQGLRRHWSRSTRYDFYFPAFAHLGEQAVLSKEIYCDGSAADNDVFGYQERWAEYRYSQPAVTGLFRSTTAGTLDAWHMAQRFTSRPVLGGSFIDENPPLSRVLAVGTGANGQQFIFDSVFDMKVTRPMPLYSVPGLMDHF